MNMVLYINSCTRENSRTDRIARALLKKTAPEYTELYLAEEGLAPLSREALHKRTCCINNEDYSDPMFRYAKQFAQAETIVISAPYWDLSFPALLKLYIENIYVTGIVSKYGPDGTPIGLCKAKELIYVTTSGGPFQADYSYGYIRALATEYFGIKHTRLIAAEMLDVDGMDAEQIVQDTIRNL